ncbi:NGP1NT-domain-containing protein [Rickenella mellea]|uniref:Nucleolar GTP-binding protein 2 n=1 Tax=Rickenella mellea TaxID=50990 RepID=A0A4Y7Q026_9AGAM|nr:NGP1NT-domain-containing protein [Rickenella mellea]
MGITKKKSTSSPSKTRSSSSSGAISLKRVKGENFYRDAKAASRLKMLSGGKPVYDRDGKIKQAAAFQKGEDETKPGRVQPDRRWFGNTRVISQTALDHFRTSLSTKAHDPYSVLLRRNKLPMALLDDAANPHTRKRSHIVETEPFSDTFGPKAQRKKPRIDVGSFEELSKLASVPDEEAATGGQAPVETASATPQASSSQGPTHADYIEPIYAKGTSRRIYGELYKVIDSSDVILHILDARDPLGTMCESVLEYIRKEKSHKQVVLIINKCDLVPNWVTARYVQHLTPRYPTLAFHASPNHSFGKGSLIQLLRQFSQLHSDKKQISVGFIGYPNVGKSSVINTLKSGKVCRVAPIPGETKVWQYITLTRRIYLIDCPGIVPTSAHDSQTSTVLKGVLRVEALPTPSEHIPALMERIKPLYLSRTYNVPLPNPDDPTQQWNPDEFMDKLARMKGRLLKGGEPDLEGVAKIVLSDWVRGRIPFFVAPPERPAELNAEEEAAAAKAAARGKGKGKEKDAGSVPGVTQKLSGIMQKNTFVGDDVQPLEESHAVPAEDAHAGDDDDGDADVQSDDEQDDDEELGSGGEGGDDNGDEDEELVWDDVWEGIGGSAVEKTKVPPVSVNDDVSDSGSDQQSRKKEPRMKTNKRKATNFFSTANVKNKSRKKRPPLPTESSAKRKGKGPGRKK